LPRRPRPPGGAPYPRFLPLRDEERPLDYPRSRCHRRARRQRKRAISANLPRHHPSRAAGGLLIPLSGFPVIRCESLFTRDPARPACNTDDFFGDRYAKKCKRKTASRGVSNSTIRGVYSGCAAHLVKELSFPGVLNRASFQLNNAHSNVYRDFEIVNPGIAVWRTSYASNKSTSKRPVPDGSPGNCCSDRGRGAVTGRRDSGSRLRLSSPRLPQLG
jgi:hypothetical protein